MRSPDYYAYINSPVWQARSRFCQLLTGHRCVLFPWLKSRHCHHMTYRHFKHEQPWRDTVPLSKTAHSIIHWWIFWKTPLRVPVNVLLRLLMLGWMGGGMGWAVLIGGIVYTLYFG